MKKYVVCGLMHYLPALIVIWLGPFFISCVGEKKDTSKTRPNILLILGDDHTTQAISAYGGILAPYARTTQIDRLAAEGIRFNRAFCTNAICSPARATLLTGKYSHKNGIRILGETFDTIQMNVAKILQNAGYSTAVFGKWHLKSIPAGFDEYKVLQVQGRYRDPQFVEKGQDSLVTRSGWSTDIIADLTIKHLQAMPVDQPWFVMTHFKATHDPWASRPPYDTLWQNINLPEPSNLLDENQRSSAALHTTLKLELINQSTYPHQRLEKASWQTQRKFIYQQYIKDFLRCGRVLDENVGKIISHLEKGEQLDNTVIIYLADQGHFLGEHGFFSKRFMYEEAMRIPLIIRYPKLIDSATITTALTTNLDIAPTLLEFAGISAPPEMQGRSLIPLLDGDTPERWRKTIYYRYWQHLLHRQVPAHIGIRTDRYKLIFYHGQPLGLTDFPATAPEFELFDLVNDPLEMNNIYDSTPVEIKNQLKSELIALKNQFEDHDELPVMRDIMMAHFN